MIEGIEDMLVHYARCCSPVKGDPIAGFVTRGRGLTVHRVDCPRMLDLDPERKIHVVWDSGMTLKRPISIQVISDDREGMLADLSATFTRSGVRSNEANCRVIGDGHAINTFQCGIVDLEQLRKVVKSLERIKGVHSVERARTTED